LDPDRFDALARTLAAPRTRRRALLGGAGGALALLGLAGPDRAAADTLCKPLGKKCNHDAQCCAGHCPGGVCAACARDADCDDHDPCTTDACVGGTCVSTPKTCDDGNACTLDACDPATGQCLYAEKTCDDGNPCTDNACDPSTGCLFPPSAAGTACPGGVCDGSGSCVGCLTPSDCPGQDTDCQKRTCTNGTCGTSYAPNGTPTPTQIRGDCRQNVCDGAAGVTTIADDADVPADDGNPCTIQHCNNGVPGYLTVKDGDLCGECRACSGGACVVAAADGTSCGVGSVCCDGSCHRNDSSNCGACGHVCSGTCKEGACCNDQMGPGEWCSDEPCCFPNICGSLGFCCVPSGSTCNGHDEICCSGTCGTNGRCT
jgi:hypothetical protein